MGDFMAMFRSTLLTFTVFCLFNQVVLADINSANAALARGDYAAASAEFLRLAKNGDAKAQAHLGYMYYVGEGVQQDYAEAIKWYRKAAVQGDKDAQYNLAVAYAFGEGTKQDYKEAATWYRRAAEQGHVIAQYSLGISYSYGEGVKQDSAEALKWFQRSADQGYARAQVQLATKYHTGDGVALNYQEAVKWYRQAADRGNAAAQYNLGTMFRSGKGVTQDYNQAVRWYRLAADQGYAAATNELASLERVIAGASRSRSKPDLQPRPAPVKQIAKAEAPAEEPLLTVEKSDLLTLDNEEEQVEDTAMAEVADQMEVEEKKPGRVSGFFKKFFKKKEAQPETAMVEEAEPESIEELQEAAETDVSEDDSLLAMDSIDAADEAVPVEDLSEAITDTTDEMQAEREVVTNDASEKKSRFGFFKKLFGKKDSSEEVPVEDHMLAETDADASMETESNEVESTLQEEVAITDTETADEMDALETEEQPKKKGFFKRLFGKKKDADETVVEESDPLTTDDIAIVDDRAFPEPMQEEEVTMEEDASIDAMEPEEKPKKKGFFKRLFGKKKDEGVAEDMDEETDAMATDTIAMVDDSADTIPVMEEEIAIDSSAEEEAAMDALESEEKPKKKGFFKRLFGKSDDEAEEAESPAEEITDSDDADAADYPSEPGFVADASDLKTAQLALDNRNYDTAFNSFNELAVQGDATAQYQLGLLYYQGLGVEQNYGEASHWYRQAGEQGNADAQYSLGNMFLMGEGVSQDDSLAISWYEKAADQGHVAARHNANNLKRVTAHESVSADEIESALETEQTEETVAEYEAAQEEKPKKSFFKRLFGKKDQPEESVEEETSAAIQGPLPEIQPEPEPEEEVVEAEPVKKKKKGFFGRLFGKKDKDEAEMAASGAEIDEAEDTTMASPVGEPDQSIEEALAAVEEYETGLAYSFGDGVPQDNKLAFNAFLRAAESGHTPAQYKTGIAYAYGEGVDKDPERALYWYKKAAKKGYALAQRNLGVMYMSGDGIEQNKPLAFAWHSILADSGNVMDVHRRDALQQQLTEDELEVARAIKASLKH
jgi:TPR repeat protein